jgi:inosine-uridine nucleoside N-ribohydrolase
MLAFIIHYRPKSKNMKKQGFNFLMVCFLLEASLGFAQEKIIFDTDLGGDADDLGALVMLHNFMDRGECDLLAIMCWSQEESVIPAIDAVNRYYKHPEIALGVRKGSTFVDSNNYGRPLADRFPHEQSFESVPDVVDLYRKILSENEDTSVVILTVGPLKNIQNLLGSGADHYSALSGRELINRKVKEFVIMGGQFPDGSNEWNFNGNMPGVTRSVLDQLSVAVTFSGFELGVQIKTGEVFNRIDQNTPLYVGFMHFSQHAPWMKEQFRGNILDNSTFDQTAVLYAVKKGIGTYWDRVEGGYCLADNQGGNRWIKKQDSNHSYLKLSMDPEEMAKLIESIMLNQF